MSDTRNTLKKSSENSSPNVDAANDDGDYGVIQGEDLPHAANGE